MYSWNRKHPRKGERIELNGEDHINMTHLNIQRTPFEYDHSARAVIDFILPMTDDDLMYDYAEAGEVIATRHANMRFWNEWELNITNRYKTNLLKNPEHFLPPGLLWMKPKPPWQQP